jgi:hypothetical protein
MNGPNTFFIVFYREVDAHERERDINKKNLLNGQDL